MSEFNYQGGSSGPTFDQFLAAKKGPRQDMTGKPARTSIDTPCPGCGEAKDEEEPRHEFPGHEFPRHALNPDRHPGRLRPTPGKQVWEKLTGQGPYVLLQAYEASGQLPPAFPVIDPSFPPSRGECLRLVEMRDAWIVEDTSGQKRLFSLANLTDRKPPPGTLRTAARGVVAGFRLTGPYLGAAAMGASVLYLALQAFGAI